MTSVDYVLPSRWGVYRSQQTSVRGQQGWHSAQQMSVDIQQRLRMAKSPPTWHCISPGTYYQCQEKGEGETSEMMGEKIVREGERCQIQKWSLFVRKQKSPDSDLYSLSHSPWLLISDFSCTNHQPLLVPQLGSIPVPERVWRERHSMFWAPHGS